MEFTMGVIDNNMDLTIHEFDDTWIWWI